MIDAASGGSITNKSLDEAHELINSMASNNYSDRSAPRKAAGVFEVDQAVALAAQMSTLQQQMNQMMSVINAPTKICNLCGGGHFASDCQVGNPFAQPEQVNFTNNYQRGQENSFQSPYSQTYNPNWRNHPNLSWSNNQNVQQQPQPQRFEQKQVPNDMFTRYMQENDARLKNQEASIKNIETQIGQLTSLLTARAQGALPSDTEKNPREQVNAITLRSGTRYDEPQASTSKEAVKEPEIPPAEEEVNDEVKEQEEKEKERKRIDKEVQRYKEKYNRIPFPSRLKKQTEDTHYRKFLDMFQNLHINIPFADVLEQMPRYAKYLKEMLTKKRSWAEHETVILTEESSALLRKKLPPKLKDPGSFSIPCKIGSLKFENALCDLGASVNLLPYSLFKKLNIGEVKPTKITLRLADRSIIHPREIVEDVLIKVDKFIFPIDLVVLDMEEDRSIPIILGRGFLKTARAIIDVDGGKMILRVGDESVEFQ